MNLSKDSKICSKCKIEKSLDNFGNKKDSKDGKNTRCKNCLKKCNKEYQQTNSYKEHLKEYLKEYHKEYKQTDKCKEYQKEYEQTDKRKKWKKEHFKDCNKEYRDTHKEYFKEYQQTDNFKISTKKSQNKRKRSLGFIPLNKTFNNCNSHHINEEIVINIPIELHKSIWHTVVSCNTYDKLLKLADINDKAFKWYFTHEK